MDHRVYNRGAGFNRQDNRKNPSSYSGNMPRSERRKLIFSSHLGANQAHDHNVRDSENINWNQPQRQWLHPEWGLPST